MFKVKLGLIISLLIITSLWILRARQDSSLSSGQTQAAISPEDWFAKGKYFTYKQNEIFYLDEGQGDNVLLLHGYPTSSWDYHKLWETLSHSHRLLAPDLLGYGYSSKPKTYPYAIQDHADMIVELLQNHDISNIHLIAHDIGVNVVQELVTYQQQNKLDFDIASIIFFNGTLFDAERQPQLIQRLLMSPSGGLVNRLASERTYIRNLNRITAGENLSNQELSIMWYLLNYPNASRLTHKLLHSVKDRELNDLRWADALCNTDIALHFIIGPEDPSSGLRMPASLQEYCNKDFSTTVLAGSGHFPHLEAPEDTSQAILQWYKHLSTDGF